MEKSNIEKLDKSTYNMQIWMTIGFGLFFGETILTEFVTQKSILLVIHLLGLVGWLFFLKSSLISYRINKQLKQNTKLKEALNNEMYKLYVLKSCMIGFFTLIFLLSVFIFLSFLTELPLRVSLEIILYIGVLSVFISGLIYNKG